MEPKIKAMTVDAGGTLIFPWPSVGEIYAQVAAAQGFCAPPPERINANFARAWGRRTVFAHSPADWWSVVRESFGEEFPLSKRLFEAIYEEFSSPGRWRILDGAEAVLKAARARGVGLAVVSNWDERLRPLLRRLGIDGWFDHLVVSHDLGVAKPDGRIFRHACERLGVDPIHALHVGDSPREDVAGAAEVGMRTWHLRREPGGELAGGDWGELGRWLEAGDWNDGAKLIPGIPTANSSEGGLTRIPKDY